MNDVFEMMRGNFTNGQKTMGDDGRMSAPKVVDKFAGKEAHRWGMGGERS